MIFDRWRGRPDRERPAEPPAPRVVPVRGEGIRLGQLLKLADMIDSGSDARPLLADGLVLVNGEVETRRGRQLVRGDVVTVGDQSVQVG